LYLAPAVLIFLVFTIAPTIFVVYISLFHWSLLNPKTNQFRGLANYGHLLTSAAFWHSMWLSLYFVGASVVVSVVAGFLIALLLASGTKLRRAFRLAVFSPYFTPVVATALVWIFLFNPEFGLIDGLLHAVGLPRIGWLDSRTWAMPGVIIYTLWHSLGFTVIIFLAGLASISTNLREAARVDGAPWWREVWNVVLPQLTPTVLFVAVITTITSLQAFTQFYVMTAGGPLGATTTTGYLLYEEGFVFYHTGYGAAIAVVLFALIAALTLLQFKATRRRGRA